MANRVIKETYGNTKEILKFNEFTAITVTVDMVKGLGVKEVIPAGTIIGGKTNSILGTEGGDVAVAKNTAAAEGVLLYDVDVTNGPREGAMVIAGFIDLAKIPKAPAETVDLPRITFLY